MLLIMRLIESLKCIEFVTLQGDHVIFARFNEQERVGARLNVAHGWAG